MKMLDLTWNNKETFYFGETPAENKSNPKELWRNLESLGCNQFL